ncbi:two-component sensor histidine kinase [Streptomyces sp. RKND-216]|uniref:sensor histidine kinase n=1 Tax=Streptomyces sp. RKND-216 TaxID=2562581 RepID=UPI00109DFBD2|nr:sensor histidine kinase [Streptomyces sp. RKND-216]THA26361.1 two-component sensor histidine kinase [Streptomyces sp. RKND-216]
MTSRDEAPWHLRHWAIVDAAIAAFFVLLDTVLTLAGTTWWPERPGALAWTMLGLQALACASLAARRCAPIAVVVVLGAFTLAITLLIHPFGALTPAHENNLWAPFATVLAAYGPLFYQQNRRAAFVALAVFTLIVMRPWQPSWTVLTIGLLRTAVGPLLALYFEARRKLVLALTERAERAERERHLLAERARAEERARLAGEMHDVVTHRVSLMALQAGALRMTATDEATRKAAEDLRQAGCQALDELRDLVGILRTEPEGDGSPSVAELPTLVAESAGAGVDAELLEEGDPGLASPVVGRTAYRIVREALTNAHKHAPGAKVEVRVHYEESQVRIAVHNTPPTARPSRELVQTGSGLGIVNLRQRVEVLRGTLRAGSAPDGGFCVEATLPAYVPTAESAV